MFNSGKTFEEWAESKPIRTATDNAKDVPTYDASLLLAGLPRSKVLPDEKTGVGVCEWGDRWYNKNKRIPDKLTVKLPERWVGKCKDHKWFLNVQELEKWARAVAYACYHASAFCDRNEIKIIYEGMYQRCEERAVFRRSLQGRVPGVHDEGNHG